VALTSFLIVQSRGPNVAKLQIFAAQSLSCRMGLKQENHFGEDGSELLLRQALPWLMCCHEEQPRPEISFVCTQKRMVWSHDFAYSAGSVLFSLIAREEIELAVRTDLVPPGHF
jgi:hypothetical protein